VAEKKMMLEIYRTGSMENTAFGNDIFRSVLGQELVRKALALRAAEHRPQFPACVVREPYPSVK
jgi:hypothetical protein